jgi:hypothetical protein
LARRQQTAIQKMIGSLPVETDLGRDPGRSPDWEVISLLDFGGFVCHSGLQLRLAIGTKKGEQGQSQTRPS